MDDSVSDQPNAHRETQTHRTEIDFTFVVIVVISYVALASLVLWWTSVAVKNAYLPQFNTHHLSNVEKVFRHMLILTGLAVTFVAGCLAMVDKDDRRVVLVRLLWTMGVPVALVVVLGILRSAYWAISEPQFWAFAGILFVFTPLWMQLSSPILRSWAAERYVDAARVAKIEKIASWPFSEKDLSEIEISLPRKKYFAAMTGLGAVLFLILETVLGEFLSNSFSISGYVGSCAIGLVVASAIYPIHNWATTAVELHQNRVADMEKDEELELTKEVVSKSVNYYKLMFGKYIHIFIPSCVLATLIGTMIAKYL
jgi:hypothetical protein